MKTSLPSGPTTPRWHKTFFIGFFLAVAIGIVGLIAFVVWDAEKNAEGFLDYSAEGFDGERDGELSR